MKNFGLLAALVAAISFLGVLSSTPPAFAAVHCMRVYGVMGGLDGDTSIQYVELRMSAGGQVFTGGSQLHFYNAAGTETMGSPFTLTTNMTNGSSGDSILIGTSNFDAAWAVGSPDFIMPANLIAPNGKVLFGPPGGGNCIGQGRGYDSLAYGSGYTGTVEYEPAPAINQQFAMGLPTTGNQAIQIIRSPEHFDFDQDTNATDYEIVSNPMPCKNAPMPVCGAVLVDDDLDDDGVLNPDDDCPNTAPAAAVDANGCSDAQADTDGDGWCNPGIVVPGGFTPACTLGPDNCPNVANPGNPQPNVDGDVPGDACDTEGPNPNTNGVAGGNDCTDLVDNDGDTLVDGGDPGCDPTDSDGDGIPNVIDNCPSVANMSQENYDGDSLGDACDTEDDGDGYSDEAEAGTPVCANIINDDIDPVDAGDASTNDGCPAVGASEGNCADAMDNDLDGRVNDGCPQVGTLAEGSFKIGTGTLARCGVGTVPTPSIAWPADLTSGANNIDSLATQDVTSFVAPAPRKYLTNPGEAGFNSRWDLVPGRASITLKWIGLNDLTSLVAGVTGMPPMFGGSTKAFSPTGGPICNDPP